MQAKIRIGRREADRLQEGSLFHLSKLVKAGIIEIAYLGTFSFPVSSVHAYLHLQYFVQNQLQLSNELNDFIDEIVTNRQAICDNYQSNSDDSLVLLKSQLIESILKVNPKAIERYRIEDSFKVPILGQRIGGVFVSDRNGYAVGNIQNLCISALNHQNLSNAQRLGVIRDVLLPIYFSFAAIDSKLTLEAIKRSIAVSRANHFQSFEQELSKLFVSFYVRFWSTVNFSNSNIEHVNYLENQFTLLEVIHQNVPYPDELVRSTHFRTHLKGLLQFWGQNRGSVHLLAIKVYERTAACLGQMGNLAEVFMKVFNILSCYGSHLVKDVWSSFYGLLDGGEYAVFDKLQLIDIVLGKLQHHENSNVIKNCLHQLLKNQQSNRIFEHTPTVVYNSLIRMLNLGAHYLDCMFHMDSKMYPLVASFFLRYYNSTPSPPHLDRHLNWLLQSILAKSNYDHALIALLGVFLQQKKKTIFLGLNGLNSTKALLTAAYARFPIRKRYQLVDSLLGLIAKNVNSKEVHIDHLLEYFSIISQEYLIQANLHKLKTILEIYSQIEREEWARTTAEDIVRVLDVKLQGACEDLESVYKKIKMLELYQRLYKVRFVEYEKYFLELIKQYGDSQYKNQRQRQAIITIYSLIKQNLIPKLNLNTSFVPHLQAVLSCVALYSQYTSQKSVSDCRREAIEIVGYLFRRCYGWIDGQSFKEREGERVILARMMEWASDRIDEEPLALDIIIQACRARIQVQMKCRQNPHLYKNYSHLFQETLYDLYDQISQLQVNVKHICKCSNLSRDKQLRLRVLLTTILLHDSTHKLSHFPPECDDIGQIIDRYDFESYEEVCWMIQAVYSNSTAAFAKNKEGMVSEQEAGRLCRQFQLLLENMVHNLEYSLGKKEILAISECTMRVILSFAYSTGSFSPSLIQFSLKLLKAGDSYLIFQRVVALRLANTLFVDFHSISQLACNQLMPLIIQILTIQQYRGFDSAVYLAKQNLQDSLYATFDTDLQSNYEGAIPRFLTIFAFKQIVQGQLNKRDMLFLESCIEAAFEVCMSVVAKQKMFLSGRNKLKLQLWQFLLVFPPHTMPLILGRQKFGSLLLRSIQAIGHNLISQIRYYSEMFLMRMLTCKANFSLISKQALIALQKGLQQSVGNVNRTIAYIVVSGILIKHISKLSESNGHFSQIKNEFVSLYNSLLTYVGSSVAYFRGLSQFFCLQFTSGCLETKYVAILRQNFLMDKDAEQLIQKLKSIMNGYMQQIEAFEIEQQVLRKTPNSNRNVVSNTYYMDVLKQFSTELAKINKNLDGFTAYRYIWRKNVAKGEIEQQIQQQNVEAGEQPAPEQQQQDIFQRKIDPTLDHLYGQDRKSQLKILVTSTRSQVLIGHLARTGEIFGIQELIVPCRKVIQLDQFKSISVTAQRWLNISDLGAELGAKVRQENILKCLIKLKSEGCEVVRLAKWQGGSGLSRKIEIPRKCVLVVDQEGCLGAQCLRMIDWELQVGRHLSLHVEASIFIWSYFKRHVNGTSSK